MPPRLAVVDDPSFDEHRAPPAREHPERPERLTAARRAVAAVAPAHFGVVVREATDDELSRVHTASYVDALGRTAGRWEQWDEDTYAAPQSVRAARRAAGGAIELVDAVLDGEARRGVALLRPPGHHARPNGAMGFCLLNNVAVAAAHARARGLERVLIVDFDVHHGNGTQEIFYDDPSVLFLSLHQAPFYPGTGSATELGANDGRGRTLNVPLSHGAGNGVYAAAFTRLVSPVATEFAPELVLVSAGFDAHARDPLGGMAVTEAGYRFMVGELVRALPHAPIALVLEGGYDLAALEASLGASLGALLGEPSEAALGFDAPSPTHEAELERAALAASSFWRLS